MSVADNVRINLSEAVEGWEADQVLDKSVFNISPYVEGKAIVTNSHSINFIPDETLEPDTEYTVTINLGEIYNDIPKEF